MLAESIIVSDRTIAGVLQFAAGNLEPDSVILGSVHNRADASAAILQRFDVAV
jgi:hypothetical protein